MDLIEEQRRERIKLGLDPVTGMAPEKIEGNQEKKGDDWKICECCKGMKPILPDDCLCFPCSEYFRKGYEPTTYTTPTKE